MKNPKSILITGASSGIGEALALAYAKPEVHLFLLGRDEQRLSKVANACTSLGAQVKTASIEVQDAEAIWDWVMHCDALSPLDLVIANAGISNARKEASPERERLIFSVNLMGVLNTIYPAIELMRKRGKGQLALMSSLAAMYGLPGSLAYSASKSAVKTYGESLRGKLKAYGVEVSVICPGFIKTAMTAPNDYSMPFIMSATEAVDIIIKGLAKNKGLIAFPWQMYFFLWTLRILPHTLAEKIAARI